MPAWPSQSLSLSQSLSQSVSQSVPASLSQSMSEAQSLTSSSEPSSDSESCPTEATAAQMSSISLSSLAAWSLPSCSRAAALRACNRARFNTPCTHPPSKYTSQGLALGRGTVAQSSPPFSFDPEPKMCQRRARQAPSRLPSSALFCAAVAVALAPWAPACGAAPSSPPA